MKKKITLLLLLIGPMLLAQSVFDKFESHESVSYMSISPRLFQMMASMKIHDSDPEAKEFFELANNINSFKVLRTDDDQISEEFTHWVEQHIVARDFEELMRAREGKSRVKFYVKEGIDPERIEELLMLVSDAKMNDAMIRPQTVLLVIKGNIDLERISSLTKKMDLPGSDELKELKKQKENE